jgi:hypothetical protein
LYAAVAFALMPVPLYKPLCAEVVRKEEPMNNNPLKMQAMLEEYYRGFDEAARLANGLGELKRVRTINILARYLPPPPATVLDIGARQARMHFHFHKQAIKYT